LDDGLKSIAGAPSREVGAAQAESADEKTWQQYLISNDDLGERGSFAGAIHGAEINVSES
jgi:hypothetical protein